MAKREIDYFPKNIKSLKKLKYLVLQNTITFTKKDLLDIITSCPLLEKIEIFKNEYMFQSDLLELTIYDININEPTDFIKDTVFIPEYLAFDNLDYLKNLNTAYREYLAKISKKAQSIIGENANKSLIFNLLIGLKSHNRIEDVFNNDTDLSKINLCIRGVSAYFEGNQKLETAFDELGISYTYDVTLATTHFFLNGTFLEIDDIKYEKIKFIYEEDFRKFFIQKNEKSTSQEREIQEENLLRLWNSYEKKYLANTIFILPLLEATNLCMTERWLGILVAIIKKQEDIRSEALRLFQKFAPRNLYHFIAFCIDDLEKTECNSILEANNNNIYLDFNNFSYSLVSNLLSDPYHAVLHLIIDAEYCSKFLSKVITDDVFSKVQVLKIYIHNTSKFNVFFEENLHKFKKIRQLEINLHDTIDLFECPTNLFCIEMIYFSPNQTVTIKIPELPKSDKAKRIQIYAKKIIGIENLESINSNLAWFHLAYSDIVEVPSWVNQCKKLNNLSLNNNKIRQIPDFLFKFIKRSSPNLMENPIENLDFNSKRIRKVIGFHSYY